MRHATERRTNRKRWLLGGMALLLGGVAVAVQHPTLIQNTGSQAMNAQAGFHCNAKVLTREERAQHKRLTDKLLAMRKATVEMQNGYDFQYQAGSVSLAELADWVMMESKCCPFFDFHIDLEREGTIVCLRLTGKEGIKPFIRAEFQVDSK